MLPASESSKKPALDTVTKLAAKTVFAARFFTVRPKIVRKRPYPICQGYISKLL